MEKTTCAARGQRRQYPLKMQQNTFFTKNYTKFLYFSAQNPALEVYSDHSRVRSAPPKSSAHSKTKLWLHLWRKP